MDAIHSATDVRSAHKADSEIGSMADTSEIEEFAVVMLEGETSVAVADPFDAMPFTASAPIDRGLLGVESAKADSAERNDAGARFMARPAAEHPESAADAIVVVPDPIAGSPVSPVPEGKEVSALAAPAPAGPSGVMAWGGDPAPSMSAAARHVTGGQVREPGLVRTDGQLHPTKGVIKVDVPRPEERSSDTGAAILPSAKTPGAGAPAEGERPQVWGNARQGPNMHRNRAEQGASKVLLPRSEPASPTFGEKAASTSPAHSVRPAVQPGRGAEEAAGARVPVIETVGWAMSERSPELVAQPNEMRMVPSGAGVISQPVQQSIPTATLRHMAATLESAIERPIEIALSPAELGRVSLRMTPTEAGISVSIVAERVETLDLLRRHAGELGGELRGLGYGAISFSFGNGNHGESRHGDDQKRGQGGEVVGADTQHHTLIFRDGGEGMETLDLRL